MRCKHLHAGGAEVRDVEDNVALANGSGRDGGGGKDGGGEDLHFEGWWF